MTKAVAGTFADFKLIRGRKVAQIIVEVPIEQADSAVEALGGLPRPDVERWVGLAPLSEEPTPRPAQKPKEPRHWEMLSYAEQAGIRCADPEFQAWLSVNDAIEAAAQVREFCEVDSRTALNTDREAASRWQQMDADYRARNIGSAA